jgi:Dienelactone hydrolase family
MAMAGGCFARARPLSLVSGGERCEAPAVGRDAAARPRNRQAGGGQPVFRPRHMAQCEGDRRNRDRRRPGLAAGCGGEGRQNRRAARCAGQRCAGGRARAGACPGVAIGWSRGGEGALWLASGAEGGTTGVKAGIVYYPSVRGQPQPYTQLHPVLALQGTGDGVAPAANLQRLVAGRQPLSIEFSVRLFAGAKHRFDVAHPVSDPAEPRAPGDYDAKAATEALAAISAFLDKYGIGSGGCALD